MSASKVVQFSALVAMLCVAGAMSARAHDEKVSASEVDISGATVVWKVDVGLDGLAKVVKFPAEPAALSETQLESVRDAIARYLILSTKRNPAVAVYPDSNKLAIWRLGNDGIIVRRSDAVDYWEGETP